MSDELAPAPAAVNPGLLLAEVLLWLHQQGVDTSATWHAAEAAAAELLRAVGVDPAAGPALMLIQYRVDLVGVRRSVLAVDEVAAEVMARAWRALPRPAGPRTAVVVRPVGVPLPVVPR